MKARYIKALARIQNGLKHIKRAYGPVARNLRQLKRNGTYQSSQSLFSDIVFFDIFLLCSWQMIAYIHLSIYHKNGNSNLLNAIC